MEADGTPTYEDFKPKTEWVHEDDLDTLLIYVPGFSKNHMRVQLVSSAQQGSTILRITGQRRLHHNTWSRFRIEFPVSENCDLIKISAKFEGGILYVKQPTLVSLAEKPKEEIPTPMPTPPKPVDEPEEEIPAPMPTPQKPVDEPEEESPAPMPTPQKPVDEPEEESPAPMPTPQKPVDEPEEEIPTPMPTPPKPVDEPEEESLAPMPTPQKPVDEPNVSPKTTNETPPAQTSQPNTENKEAEKDQDVLEMSVQEKVLKNYKRVVSVFATKLKTSKNTADRMVILLVGLMIGIYVSYTIKSFVKD